MENTAFMFISGDQLQEVAEMRAVISIPLVFPMEHQMRKIDTLETWEILRW
jgi:ABC-type sugar transport system ATPase subunit